MKHSYISGMRSEEINRWFLGSITGVRRIDNKPCLLDRPNEPYWAGTTKEGDVQVLLYNGGR